MMRGSTNPLNIDPEGSPARPNGGFYGQQEDPWYSNSGQESPASDNSRGPTFDYSGSFNMMGSNNQADLVSSEVDYENEAPLLEELGIHFDHIWAKTQAVLIPTKVKRLCFTHMTWTIFIKLILLSFSLQQINAHILDDADLAGPLCFCLLLGSCLLLSGKVRNLCRVSNFIYVSNFRIPSSHPPRFFCNIP